MNLSEQQRFLESLIGMDVDRHIKITSATVHTAVALLRQLNIHFPFLLSPAIAASPDAAIGITWDRAEHHLEVEIYPNKKIIIYYRNRTTKEDYHHQEFHAGKIMDSEKYFSLFCLNNVKSY